MSGDEFYVHCLLKKKAPDGYYYRTTWLPERFAVVGKCVKLKDIDGWIVFKTFTREDKKTVEKNERNYLKHREATDI